MQYAILYVYANLQFSNFRSYIVAVAYVCKRTPAPEMEPKIMGLRVKAPEIVPVTTNTAEQILVDRCIFW